MPKESLFFGSKAGARKKDSFIYYRTQIEFAELEARNKSSYLGMKIFFSKGLKYYARNIMRLLLQTVPMDKHSL